MSFFFFLLFRVIALYIFRVNTLCKFGHQQLVIKISQILLQLVASDILPGEKDGGQANGWGIVFHKHSF